MAHVHEANCQTVHDACVMACLPALPGMAHTPMPPVICPVHWRHTPQAVRLESADCTWLAALFLQETRHTVAERKGAGASQATGGGPQLAGMGETDGGGPQVAWAHGSVCGQSWRSLVLQFCTRLPEGCAGALCPLHGSRALGDPRNAAGGAGAV